MIKAYVQRLLGKVSPEELAARELDDARRSLLEAQSGREYADSMCKYHEARIKRLTAILAQQAD